METRDPARAARKYITFQISGKYYALPAERVREMMPMQPLAQWPVDTAGVLGAVQTRGRFIPVFDLRNELGLPPRGSSRAESLMIVKSHDDYEFGFPVDKVTDLIHAHAHELRNETILGHGRVRTILNLDSIVSQERLFAAAFSRISFSNA